MTEGCVSVKDGDAFYSALCKGTPVLFVVADALESCLMPPLWAVLSSETRAELDRVLPAVRPYRDYSFFVEEGRQTLLALLLEQRDLNGATVTVYVVAPSFPAVLPALFGPIQHPPRGDGAFTFPNRVAGRDLYIGDYESARCPYLAALGIERAVNAAGVFASPAHVPVHVVAVADDDKADIAAHFDAVTAFVGQSVCLIYCAAGISRSATLAAVVLMRRFGLTLRAALAELRAARPCVRPNRGFLLQLMSLELRLFGRLSGNVYELDK